MRHILAVLLACLLSSLLTGCIEYEEVLQINADGSASIKSVVSSADLGSGFLKDGDVPFGGDEAMDSEGTRVWSERRDGKLLMHVEADIEDFRGQDSLRPASREMDEFTPNWYSVEPLGFGRYKLSRTISTPDALDSAAASEAAGPLGAMGGELGKSLMKQMLEGHEFSVTLKAPFILSSNATTTAGKQTATWTSDMASIADGVPFTIEATVLLLDMKLIAVAGGLLLLLLVMAMVLAARRRKGAGARREMPRSIDSPDAGL